MNVLIFGKEVSQGGANRPTESSTLDLEENDSAHAFFRKPPSFGWQLYGTSVSDVDLIKIKIANAAAGEMVGFNVNQRDYSFRLRDLFSGAKKISIGTGIALVYIGTRKYVHSKIDDLNIAVADFIRAGKGRNYSAPLQAWLWAAIDGKLQVGENPLKGYSTFVRFTEMMWKKTEGSRDKEWSDYETVITRLNRPELVELYMRNHFSHRINKQTYRPIPPERMFSQKWGDCKGFAGFTLAALKIAGFKGNFYTMDPKSPTGHTVALIEIPDNDPFLSKGKFAMTSPIGSLEGMHGPYEKNTDINDVFGFSRKRTLTESQRQINRRFGI